MADRSRLRDVSLDLVGACLGLFVGLPSLAFPFGRDQGLYYYVGREWFLRGAIPYRDALEQKTPGIFMLHGLALRLFGDHMWGIRVLELAAVLAMGWLAAYATAPGDRRPRPGVRGIGVLAAAIFYYGFFDFWNTAQCEIWVAFAVIVSFVFLRARSLWTAALGAGLASGVALVMKPPALFFTIVCFAFLLRRVAKEAPTFSARAKVVAAFGACAALPWVLILAYFGAKGALPALVDVLVGANGYYVKHERGVDTVLEVVFRTIDVVRIFNPLSTLLAYATVAGFFFARKRGDQAARDAHLVVAATALATFLSVLMQLKFYMYHWGVLVAPAALAATATASDLVRVATERGWRIGRVTAALIANAVVLFLFSFDSERLWFWETYHVARHELGRESRAELSGFFRVDVLDYDFGRAEEVGRWLEQNTSPDDRVAVRGFEPEIYAVAHRTYGGRFFWTSFLTAPSRAYKRQEWLAADEAELRRIRPRYVVALRLIQTGPDSPSFFESMGYTPKHDIDGFQVLERSP